jgi:hypothetical protein
MLKTYKDASLVVDEMETVHIPTRSEVWKMETLDGTLQEAKRIRRYVEAIRKEKTGREIHSKRFFLKSTWLSNA